MQREYLERLLNPKMEYYRKVYKNSTLWDGNESLENKDIIVYCEQGYGDIIQFSRYIPYLKQKGCRVHLHCPKVLHNLLYENLGGIDQIFDKKISVLPKHDFHTLTMSLPFVLDTVKVDFPYIKINKDANIKNDKFKIGIAWEGNPEHSNNDERCCPLGVFKRIHDIENVELYLLQPKVSNYKLTAGCEDMNILGVELLDFQDTAKLINNMDLIISVDTAVLHLAGSMNKTTIGLLSKRKDPRWTIGINWYPSINFVEQTTNNWLDVESQLLTMVKMKLTKWNISKKSFI